MAYDAIPAGRPWTTQGRTYQTRRLTPMALAELSNFVQAHTPDPRRELIERIKGLPPETVRVVYEAEAPNLPEWPPGDGSPRYMRTLLGTPGGLGLVVYHALRRSNPSITREQAEMIAADVELDEIQPLFEVIMPEVERDDERPSPVPPTGPESSVSEPVATNGSGPDSA